MASPDGPLLVFGPRSVSYDFGGGHPLTPLRFGPGIDLLRSVGAEPGLAPEPAPDDELAWIHEAGYLGVVRRISRDPSAAPAAGIGPGDVPAFEGMHEAGAMVAGGSLRAIEAILRGEVAHAYHPGGGLHHAMPARASGFCIYNDAALAVAAARREGLRVLYVDLDVHHGDGVEVIHRDDPGVLTVSFHESGGYLFPGTGRLDDVGSGRAAGTVVNVPLEPRTGEGGWLRAVERLVPELAAAFGPDVVVSQHGCDAHAWDPLAHLRVTTTAMGGAARLVDAVAHRRAGGRWLATGGGGYEPYRVVPRAWALTWLAGAHRAAPDVLPEAWRERWAADARAFGTYPLPERFGDEPNAGIPVDGTQLEADQRADAIAAVARELTVPALVTEAVDRGWWSPLDPADHGAPTARDVSPPDAEGPVAIVPRIDRAAWLRHALAPRVLAPADALEAARIVANALDDADASVRVTAATAGGSVVGALVSAASVGTPGTRVLLGLGVAPEFRRAGLARRLVTAHLDDGASGERWEATIGLGERDVAEPLERETRTAIAVSLLGDAGFSLRQMQDGEGRGEVLALLASRD